MGHDTNPADQLGTVLYCAREQRGWTLREAERQTGVHNAHLSQIEKGRIRNPSMALLWDLAAAYGLEYNNLLDLAGHTTRDERHAGRRSLAGATLQALEDIEPHEEEQLLAFLEQVRRRRKAQP